MTSLWMPVAVPPSNIARAGYHDAHGFGFRQARKSEVELRLRVRNERAQGPLRFRDFRIRFRSATRQERTNHQCSTHAVRRASHVISRLFALENA